MFGVMPAAPPPKQPGESQFMSSATIMRMLGRLTGADSWPQASSTTRAKTSPAANIIKAVRFIFNPSAAS